MDNKVDNANVAAAVDSAQARVKAMPTSTTLFDRLTLADWEDDTVINDKCTIGAGNLDECDELDG